MKLTISFPIYETYAHVSKTFLLKGYISSALFLKLFFSDKIKTTSQKQRVNFCMQT